MRPAPRNAADALATHWPEYLIEAALLGTFMLVACVVVVTLQHPRSRVARTAAPQHLRRLAVGVLMGLTAIALIYSPLGQRSGAHMNPGVTLTFLSLGKIAPWDAAFYIVAQFVGAVVGVLVARLLLGPLVAHPTINYVATSPGTLGIRAAWVGEFGISLVMMSMVLASSNHQPTAAYTGIFAGVLVAAFITLEAPLSGMSMNPARSLGSALPARAFRGLWIYFTAPPIGMLCAAAIYTAFAGENHVFCAKLRHPASGPCIFNCEIDRMSGRSTNPDGLGGIQGYGRALHPSPPP
jgi:aquaporin Z